MIITIIVWFLTSFRSSITFFIFIVCFIMLIGKSWFLYYAFARILHNDPTASIIFQHRGRTPKSYLFHNDSVQKGDADALHDLTLPKKNVFYLVDGSEPNPDVYKTASCTILASSPNKDTLGDYSKHGTINSKFYFSTWSFDEIRKCHSKCYSHISLDKVNSL